MDISASLDDEIGCIELNRPHLRNAISREMWDAIPHAMHSLKEAGAKVIIFAGEGDAFASGADLSELRNLGSADAASEHWMSIRNSLNAVATFELPTIAMIVGPCFGGGCLLACACDLRYCDSTARFSVPIAQLGISLDQDNIARLVGLVGRAVATEMLFTGSIISASRAQSSGLVNGMLPVVQLDRVVTTAAQEIKRNATSSIVQSKQAIAAICSQGRVEEDQELVVASYLSEEFKDRVSKALARNSST